MAISFKDKIAYVNKFADKGDDKLQKVIKLSVNIDSPKLNLTDVQKDKIKASLQVAFDRIRKIQQGTTQATKKPMLNLNALAKQIKDKEGITFDEARIKAKKAFEAKKNGQLDAVKKVLQDFKNKVGKIDYKRATTKTDIKRDMERPALRAGKRKVTTDGYTTNAYGTFKNKIGKVYYENRANRMDVNQPSKKRYPKLADGGGIGKNYNVVYEKPNSDIAYKETINASSIDEAKANFKSKHPLYDILNIREEYAKGGGVKNKIKYPIAYIDVLQSKPSSYTKVRKILEKHGIEIDNSKDFHTKGYAEELYGLNEKGQKIYTIHCDITDASKPRELEKEIDDLANKILDVEVQYHTDSEYAKGGKVKYAKGGKTKKIDYLRDAKELSEEERFELKVLQALGGFNNGLNINGLYESIGFSNYGFNQYATESQTKKVQKALSSLIKKEYVDESGLGYKITQKGANYKREFNFRSYAEGGLIFTKDVEIYRNEAPHNTFDIYEFDEAKEGSVIDKIAKGDTMSGTILGKSKGHYIFEDEQTATLYYVPTNSVKQGKKEYAKGGGVERGSAHIYISKVGGNYEVYHGDDVTLRKNAKPLFVRGNVSEGTWDKILLLLFDGKYAEGGMTEHGLKRGDTITDDMFWEDSIVVKNDKNSTRAKVNLNTGKRVEDKM